MKIAITSDTHFGDGTSHLAALDSGSNPSLGPKYAEFREACTTKNDDLIMLGDVIDVAKVFFNQIAKDEITKKNKNILLRIKIKGEKCVNETHKMAFLLMPLQEHT